MKKIILVCILSLLLTACKDNMVIIENDSNINSDNDIVREEDIKLIESLTPHGFAGSSLNKIELYSNGNVYWILYDGTFFEENNSIKKELIAKNSIKIENDVDGGIIITGEKISNVDKWIKFSNFDEENTITKLPKEIADAYIDVINNLKNNNENLQYSLIFFNNDEIPDLVVTNLGYWVSLYIYDNGKIYNIVDEWPYGAAGNSGYDYIEKSGIIINNNADYAGAIMTKSYLILNSNYEFDVLSNTFLGAEISKEDEGYELVMDAFESYGGYYYNDEKISEEDYNEKLNNIMKDDMISKIMIGENTVEEIREKLNF